MVAGLAGWYGGHCSAAGWPVAAKEATAWENVRPRARGGGGLAEHGAARVGVESAEEEGQHRHRQRHPPPRGSE